MHIPAALCLECCTRVLATHGYLPVGKKSGDKKGSFCKHDGEVDWLLHVCVVAAAAGVWRVDGFVG